MLPHTALFDHRFGICTYDYVLTCPCCQRNKAPNQKLGGFLQPLPIPHGGAVLAWTWSLLCLRLLLVTLSFVCKLTKMVHLVACKTGIGTEALAKLLRHEVLGLHGNIYEIVSDRDGHFTSKHIKDVLFC